MLYKKVLTMVPITILLLKQRNVGNVGVATLFRKFQTFPFYGGDGNSFRLFRIVSLINEWSW